MSKSVAPAADEEALRSRGFEDELGAALRVPGAVEGVARTHGTSGRAAGKLQGGVCRSGFLLCTCVK